MMEEGKKINFYRLGLENGRRYRMELTDEYRLTGTCLESLSGSSL